MSLNSVIANGLSGLHASQAAMKVISQNVANANTPGYVRAELPLSTQVIGAAGAGVEVGQLRRAADRFLAAMAVSARAGLGDAQARADMMTRAQNAFGDPNGPSSLFGAVDRAFAAFQNLGAQPNSPIARRQVLDDLGFVFADISRASHTIESLVTEADQRVAEGVTRLGGLLQRISDLNGEVEASTRAGQDATGAANLRDQLIDEASQIIDLRVTFKQAGRVELRTPAGALLVGQRAAEITYTPNAILFRAPNEIGINPDLQAGQTLDPYIRGGELKGLMQARDVDLPGLSAALGEFAAGLADALNAVHAQNTAAPAPNGLVGRQTGLLGTDALNFSGATTLAIVDSVGALTRRVAIDFTAGQITVETTGAPTTIAFANTINSFTAALNTALGPAPGGAQFQNGVLSLNAQGGLVVVDGETPTATRQGRGFAHFFGLNDIVRGDTPSFFEAGISATDAHGLIAGGAMTFRVTGAQGQQVMDRAVTVTGTSWQDLVNALNNTTTGLGLYATFSINAQGRLVSTAGSGFEVELIEDTTSRGATTMSVGALFGMDRASTAGRALELQVNPTLSSDVSRLALGRPNISADFGDRIIENGDTRGLAALVSTRDRVHSFAGAGAISAQTASIASYAARLGAEAGRLATIAERQQAGADAVYKAASERRLAVEGVNIDEELVNMTQFQQSYAAASRVIQAATEMFDVLLSIA